jgi:hypothetical protein
VGPRAGLDAVAKRKDPRPRRDTNPCRPASSKVTIPIELLRQLNQGGRNVGRMGETN